MWAQRRQKQREELQLDACGSDDDAEGPAGRPATGQLATAGPAAVQQFFGNGVTTTVSTAPMTLHSSDSSRSGDDCILLLDPVHVAGLRTSSTCSSGDEDDQDEPDGEEHARPGHAAPLTARAAVGRRQGARLQSKQQQAKRRSTQLQRAGAWSPCCPLQHLVHPAAVKPKACCMQGPSRRLAEGECNNQIQVARHLVETCKPSILQARTHAGLACTQGSKQAATRFWPPAQ